MSREQLLTAVHTDHGAVSDDAVLVELDDNVVRLRREDGTTDELDATELRSFLGSAA
jgi:hypothetical protein